MACTWQVSFDFASLMMVFGKWLRCSVPIPYCNGKGLGPSVHSSTHSSNTTIVSFLTNHIPTLPLTNSTHYIYWTHILYLNHRYRKLLPSLPPCWISSLLELGPPIDMTNVLLWAYAYFSYSVQVMELGSPYCGLIA